MAFSTSVSLAQLFMLNRKEIIVVGYVVFVLDYHSPAIPYGRMIL